MAEIPTATATTMGPIRNMFPPVSVQYMSDLGRKSLEKTQVFLSAEQKDPSARTAPTS